MQLTDADHLRQYDYGSDVNKNRYDRNKPPLYNLGNIKSLIVVYAGKNENIVNKNDFELIKDKFSERRPILRWIKKEDWNTNDHLFGKDASKIIYTEIQREIAGNYCLHLYRETRF